ncbi:hypothetical protein RA27_19855 [Ruegeria sp. ANG-R]|uniref:hypothetical protein n=1 Tax=Ruegeria sp. ANG-R TaxID=1577903 RepID=UPI00057E918D|nr:hypothetical protein [Ruegeria sp. ANG-R]KIC38675.1 hypothetical protein RA27_19855 [Ruegeria sp. ANG-R]
MRVWVGIGTMAALAACDVPQAPIVTGPDGQVRIQINTDGLTCYETRCLDIDPAVRSVRSIGSRTISIPGNIDVSDGTIAVAEFKELGTAALMAGGTGSQR